MIIDYINKMAKIDPDMIFIIIDEQSYSYQEFNDRINQVYFFLKSLDPAITRIKINLSCKLFKLASVIACNRLNKIPVLYPDKKYLLKSFDYESEARIEFELDDNSCIMQDIKKDCKKIFKYNENDVQLVLFTSGSESNPKAVELTYDNILQSSLNLLKATGLSKEDKYLNVLPLHHIAGISIFFRSIYVGCLSIVKAYDKSTILNDIKADNANVISVVPKMLDDIIPQIDSIEIIKKMKLLLIGGDSISESLYQYIYDNQINGYCTYGMTETSSGVSGYWIKNKSKFEFGYLGIPYEKSQIDISKGKIKIISNTVMKKYVNGPRANNLFLTSDYGKIVNDNIFFISRLNEVVVSGGENINLNTIRNILEKSSVQNKKIVTKFKNKKWGDSIVVLLEGKNNKKIIKNLKITLIKELPRYMVPKYYLFMDTFPYLNNYKIDYRIIDSYIKEKISDSGC